MIRIVSFVLSIDREHMAKRVKEKKKKIRRKLIEQGPTILLV